MKRMLASGLSVARGIVTVAQSQDVEWRTVGAPKPANSTPAPASQVTPVAGVRNPAENPPAPAEAEPTPATAAIEPAPLPAPASATNALAAQQQANSPVPLPAPKVVNPNGPLPGMELIPAPGTAKTEPPMLFVGPIAPEVVGPTAPLPLGSVLPQCTECFTSGVVYSGQRFFVSAEALLWWTRGVGGPPLITTGPPGTIGAINGPGVTTVLNVDDLDTQFRPGVRLRGGWWFDPCQTRGIDASVFWTPRRTGSYSTSDADFARLFRPFFVLNNNFAPIGNVPGEFSELVAQLPLVRGQVDVELQSEFWGADLNYRRTVWTGCNSNIVAFAGFRYLDLDETLTVSETILPQVPVGFGAFTLPFGSRLNVVDQFACDNDFFGGQVGANVHVQRNRWVFDIRPSVALGATRQRLRIDGSQTVAPAAVAPPGTFQGGLLATSTNIGSYSKTPFTVAPELTLNAGYQISDRWTIFAGYNFLYWSNVIRPGDQIDRNIDVTKIPNFLRPNENVPPVPGNHPGVAFSQTDFWAQGANVGAEYKW